MKNKLKVPKIEIELHIMGDNFDPNIISNILSLKATDSWRKGEPSKEFNTLKKYDCGSYSISEKESFTDDKLWNEIYNIFNKKKAELREIIESLKLDVSFDIIVEMGTDQTSGLSLDSKIIELAHSLHARIDYDLYIF